MILLQITILQRRNMTNNITSSPSTSTTATPTTLSSATIITANHSTMGTNSNATMDSITTKGQKLCYSVIQELAMNRRAPSQLRDDVFISMCSCVNEILEKHSILFTGMMERIDVTHYQIFATVANDLFEANSNSNYDTGRLKVTWARIISLFAFSVRLAQAHQNDVERVENITRFLTTYVSKHIIPFVQMNGGWEGLVDQFPPPVVDVNSQFKKAIVLSGLCVGIVATMYITSLLSK